MGFWIRSTAGSSIWRNLAFPTLLAFLSYWCERLQLRPLISGALMTGGDDRNSRSAQNQFDPANYY